MDAFDKLLFVGGVVFSVAAMPFVCAHVAETWDAEEYPYSGFCPDYPVHYENSLPPVAEDSEEAR